MYGTTLNRASLLISSLLLIASQQAAAQAGHLDPTFGHGGIVTTDFGDQGNSNKASPNAVTIQSNGKIVVGGGVPSHAGFPVPAVALSLVTILSGCEINNFAGSQQSRSAITLLPCWTCFGSGSEPCFVSGSS